MYIFLCVCFSGNVPRAAPGDAGGKLPAVRRTRGGIDPVRS